MNKYERTGAYRREIVKSGVCFRCNLSLQYMKKEKGYYAAIVEINGYEVKMHQQCAIDEIEESGFDNGRI
jgi:hypothetical protein